MIKKKPKLMFDDMKAGTSIFDHVVKEYFEAYKRTKSPFLALELEELLQCNFLTGNLIEHETKDKSGYGHYTAKKERM